MCILHFRYNYFHGRILLIEWCSVPILFQKRNGFTSVGESYSINHILLGWKDMKGIERTSLGNNLDNMGLIVWFFWRWIKISTTMNKFPSICANIFFLSLELSAPEAKRALAKNESSPESQQLEDAPPPAVELPSVGSRLHAAGEVGDRVMDDDWHAKNSWMMLGVYSKDGFWKQGHS